MRKSKVLRKLRRGEVARVCSASHLISYFPHMAAHFGYDAVWMDAEHRNWNPREIETMLMHHRLADIDCVWRPTSLEKPALSRLLEDGATGLMIPQVNTADRARQLVAATKFPPLGDRGFDGGGIDAGFWVSKPKDFPQQANRETFLVVQIETPQAVENVEEIAAVEGVDLLFLGPGDLSLRLGCTASLKDPKLLGALKRLAAAGKTYRKPWGCPVGNIDDARFLVNLGAQFIVLGSEFWGIHNHLQDYQVKLDGLLGNGAKAGTRRIKQRAKNSRY
jgi:2-keto-3-deoxy-L-rhamnonate aldolase RhmA